MVDKDYKDCKHRRLCKTAKKGKWFDCQIAGKGFNCDSTKEYCKYEPYNPNAMPNISDKDYSGCRFFHDKNLGLCSLRDDCDKTIPKCTPKCKDNPNCHYKQLQASKDECEKKDNQIKILKEKTLIYHSCKTLIDENTALKQQLGISVEALEKHCKRCSSSSVGYCRPDNCYIHIAKTALGELKN